MAIIADKEFEIHFIQHIPKGYNPYQLESGQDIIIPIKHIGNWKLGHNHK